jgi:hypothetical protein
MGVGAVLGVALERRACDQPYSSCRASCAARTAFNGCAMEDER